ncbi:MAG: pseudaminic acid synthase [Clostridium sp.]
MKNRIGNFKINEEKTFIIAEISANHLQNFERTKKIIDKIKWAGADAVKVQTYLPDTITIDCDNEYFRVNQGTIWDGTTLHKLYKEAYMPWEWTKELKEYAEGLGLIFFSSPFDYSAVDFLEELDVPCYKIASFELLDIPFIEYIASKGKTMIMSTGIAKLKDIEEAVNACYRMGNENVVLLKCTSSYPALYEDINLKTMVNMKETFDVPVGLSDHTLGCEVAIGATAMGAKVIEKHFTLRRSDGGADSQFSMEPEEFKVMVDSIRNVEKAIGKVTYSLTEKQNKSREHGRSLFIVKDINKGDTFTKENIRSIRPGYGIKTKYINEILGGKANRNLKYGTPMKWEFLDK